MEYNKISTTEKEKIQKQIDAFSDKYNKKYGKNHNFKVMFGSIAVVALFSGLVLAGCNRFGGFEYMNLASYDGSNSLNQSTYIYSRTYNDNPITLPKAAADVTRAEKEYETKLAKYLSQKTGLNVQLVDMTKLVIIQRNDEKYLLIETDMVLDANKGKERLNISLQVSNKHIQSFYTIQDKVGKGSNQNSESAREARNIECHYVFLDSMEEIIDDESTQVVSIFKPDGKKAEWYNEELDAGK